VKAIQAVYFNDKSMRDFRQKEKKEVASKQTEP